MSLLVPLLILAGVVLYLMTREERARLRAALLAGIRRLTIAAMPLPSEEPLRHALRARTRWAIVTPSVLIANGLIFGLMLAGAGPIDDPETLVEWGANFAPRTTNGEWWRLVTMMFVHAGWLHLLASGIGLGPLGMLLERFVGPVAFAAVYLAAGILAAVVSLSTSAVAVSAGASGAIFGIYGLFVATVLWGAIDRPVVPVSLATLKKVGAAAAVFVLYNSLSNSIGADAELAGFLSGLAGGLLLARGVTKHKPPLRRVAALTAIAIVLAVGRAAPLRGLVDVRPEVARVVAVEDRTAGNYRVAVERFKKGRGTTQGLAELIERTILPEFDLARTRLKTLGRVPSEQQPLVTMTEEYLALREEAWRLRAEALHQARMSGFREADRVERASLDLFERIRSADQQ